MEEPGSEKKARLTLEKARWPQGVICPDCGTAFAPKRVKKLLSPEPWPARVCERVVKNGRHQYRCCLAKCPRDAFTVSTDTFMDHSKIRYSVWLKVMDAVWEGRDSAYVSRHFGKPYETAANMVSMIRYAQKEQDLQRTLDGSWIIRSDPARYSRDAKNGRQQAELENWIEDVWEEIGE